MIKRAIWIIALVLICAYFINNYIENRAKERAKRAENKRIEESIKRSVAQLVERTNAIDNWEEALKGGENFRVEPILTIDLERLWLTNRPILFIGAIKDISTASKENYVIEIEKSLFSMMKYSFLTDLILELNYQKDKMDLFLKTHPDILKSYGFKNGVAVVADIRKIETKTIPDKDDGTREIKIGKGNCIDIIYTGGIIF